VKTGEVATLLKMVHGTGDINYPYLIYYPCFHVIFKLIPYRGVSKFYLFLIPRIFLLLERYNVHGIQ
jgi:hypothetical protein